MNIALIAVVAGVCGSLDERGFINSFDRKGFTYPRCGAELIANIYDARATQAKVIVDKDMIRLIDNGSGMNEEGIKNMFATFKENHINDNSMGVSGFGAKPSLYILSKKNEKPTTVYMYTHMDGCGYIKATIPFDKIKEEGKYSGMITYDVMNETEITRFLEERQGTNPFGTTIQWVYSETTHQYFEKQFLLEHKNMNMSDRLDCIFGKTKMEIKYKDYDTSDFVSLELYDYFSGERPDYYTGIKEDIIEHWIDNKNNDRFIWENNNKEYEFPPIGKNTRATMEEVKNKNGWKKEGFYILKNGMRRDKRLFDENNLPIISINKNGKIEFELQNVYSLFSDYDEKFFDTKSRDETKANLGKMNIIRNNQFICGIEIEKFKISSARANQESYIGTILHRSELSYYTRSKQDSRMDNAIGIQENKNQHSSDFPKGFMRLIGEIKKIRYEEVYSYFELKCKEEVDRMREEIRQQKLKEEEEKKKKEEQEEELRKQKLKEEEEEKELRKQKLKEEELRKQKLKEEE